MVGVGLEVVVERGQPSVDGRATGVICVHFPHDADLLIHHLASEFLVDDEILLRQAHGVDQDLGYLVALSSTGGAKRGHTHMEAQDDTVESGRDDGATGAQAFRKLHRVEYLEDLAGVIVLRQDLLLVLREHVDENVPRSDNVGHQVLMNLYAGPRV